MLLFSVGLLVLSAFNYGLSDQAFSSCQAMDAFEKQFGKYDAKTDAYIIPALYTSLYNSLKAGGQIIGVFIGGYVSNRWGRLRLLKPNSKRPELYIVRSSILSKTAIGTPRLTFTLVPYIDIYLGMQLAVIPTFLTELAPAKHRGGMGVLYWLSIKAGGLFITGIARATQKMTTNAAWRIPFGLILVVPFIVICLVWFIPESPRWYLLRDRQDEALRSLTRLKRQSTSEEEVRERFEILSLRVSEQLQKKSFKDLFTRQNRQRTLVVSAANFFQQATGQAFASQYGTLFVKQLKTINPFSVTLGTNAVDLGAIIISALLIDVVGRRALFHTSSSLQTVSLMTMGGLGTADSSNVDAKKGIVAMLLLFSFSWSLGWAPLTYVLGAELPSSPLREMTLQISYTVKLITEFVVTFTYPYMETADTPHHVDIGGKLGFIYGSLSAVAFVFGWFFIPETKHLEIEEIDQVYALRQGKLEDIEDSAEDERTTITEVLK
ncbi:general substrate transporter [Penicillium sp. IBT 16267x]|nr:general substrate transporter [Penicillium sp. IBT 16267x]